MISRVLLRRTLVLPILFAALAACSDDDDDNGTGTGSGSFTLGAPTGTTTIAAGSTAQLTLDVNGSGNFRAVTLTADSVPAGVSVGFAPATIVPGVEQTTVSVNVDPSRAAGTFTFRVIARAAGMPDQIQRVTITTTAAASYTLTSPQATTPVVIKRGQSGTVTLNLARLGFTGPVDIIADALPTGVTITPVTNVTGNTTDILVTTTAAAAENSATGFTSFTLRSINPSMGDRTVTVRIRVTPEYTLTNSASTTATQVVIQRTQSGTATITINRDTYQGPLTLTGTSLPTGITVPTLTNVTGNTATITINTAANAVADTGSFLITGTAPGLQNQTTRVRYRVQAEPGVQIALGNRAAQQSGIDTMFVTVNREGGFTGPVTVTLSSLPAGVTAAPVTSDTGSTVAIPLVIAADAAVGVDTVTVSVSGAAIATKTATATLTVASGLLTSGTPVTIADARGGNSRRFYRIEVPAGATSLTVTTTGGTGDVDISLRFGSPTAPSSCTSQADFNVETCTINNPAAGTWFIRTLSFAPYAGVTLTATVTRP